MGMSTPDKLSLYVTEAPSKRNPKFTIIDDNELGCIDTLQNRLLIQRHNILQGADLRSLLRTCKKYYTISGFPYVHKAKMRTRKSTPKLSANSRHAPPASSGDPQLPIGDLSIHKVSTYLTLAIYNMNYILAIQLKKIMVHRTTNTLYYVYSVSSPIPQPCIWYVSCRIHI